MLEAPLQSVRVALNQGYVYPQISGRGERRVTQRRTKTACTVTVVSEDGRKIFLRIVGIKKLPGLEYDQSLKWFLKLFISLDYRLGLTIFCANMQSNHRGLSSALCQI